MPKPYEHKTGGSGGLSDEFPSGLFENLAVGTYESPGQLAFLADMVVGNNPVLQGFKDAAVKSGKPFKQIVDEAVQLKALMSEFNPAIYHAPELYQAGMRLAGNVAGSPSNLIPGGMFAKHLAKGFADDIARTGMRNQKGAVHFGDGKFGRDTTLGRMDGGRSTGHFGTGVYALSDDAAKKAAGGQFGQGARSTLDVDLSQYNLYRPRGEDDAWRLHQSLKEINRLPGVDSKWLKSDKGQRLVRDVGFDTWLRWPDKFDSPEHASKIILRMSRAARKEEKAVRHSSKYVDSLSTRVMKKLGYEGVDVQGMGNFDTFQYGSVVYTPEIK